MFLSSSVHFHIQENYVLPLILLNLNKRWQQRWWGLASPVLPLLPGQVDTVLSGFAVCPASFKCLGASSRQVLAKNAPKKAKARWTRTQSGNAWRYTCFCTIAILQTWVHLHWFRRFSTVYNLLPDSFTGSLWK